jgi:hypothetical protein
MMKINLNDAILARAKDAAASLGYSSVEEFIEHAIEKELATLESARESTEDKSELIRQLRGLGYIK